MSIRRSRFNTRFNTCHGIIEIWQFSTFFAGVSARVSCYIGVYPKREHDFGRCRVRFALRNSVLLAVLVAKHTEREPVLEGTIVIVIALVQWTQPTITSLKLYHYRQERCLMITTLDLKLHFTFNDDERATWSCSDSKERSQLFERVSNGRLKDTLQRFQNKTGALVCCCLNQVGFWSGQQSAIHWIRVTIWWPIKSFHSSFSIAYKFKMRSNCRAMLGLHYVHWTTFEWLNLFSESLQRFVCN